MAAYNFTNKFKVGDEVICLKSRYPEAHIQPGDFGIVIEVDTGFKGHEGYNVRKKNGRGNEWCFEVEKNIDFADISKRQPEPIKHIRVKRITPPRGPCKISRLQLIKRRHKIWEERQTQEVIINEGNEE